MAARIAIAGYGAAYFLAPWLVIGVLAASGLTNPFYESAAFGVAFVLTLVAFSRWTSQSSS